MNKKYVGGIKMKKDLLYKCGLYNHIASPFPGYARDISICERKEAKREWDGFS